MNIYSSVDGTNIDKIIVLFNSVLVNANSHKKESLRFYLLVDKLPDTIPYIPKELDDILEIKELELNDRWKRVLANFNENFYKKAKWCKSDMNFARFLFFLHFPEVERVIYLDWDMIVLADIFELENEYNNFNNMIVAECGKQTVFTNIFTPEFRFNSNYNILYAKSSYFKRKYHKSSVIFDYLNISSKIYDINGFNAGFYIVSNKHFEEQFLLNLLEKLIKVQIKFKCFNFGTQVVMNLMHIINRTFIEKKWNHLPNIENLYDLKIIHWNGTEKPWNNNSENCKIWHDYCLKVYPELKDKLFIKNSNNIKKPTKNVKKIKIVRNRLTNNQRNLLKFLQSKTN